MMRYLILLISTLCISLLLANLMLFHFTVICSDPVGGSLMANETSTYNPTEESWIFAFLAIGRIIGALPTVIMINKYGLKMTVTLFGILSGLSTLLMPLIFRSFHWMLFGIGSTTVFAAEGTIPLTWGTSKEQGMFVSLLSCSYEIGPIMANGASGFFCTSSVGWPGVYYVFGTLSIVSFLVFGIIYSNNPRSNRFSQNKSSEAVYSVTQPDEPRKMESTVPYMSILSSVSVWGVWINALGDSIAYQMFIMYAPTYINKVLGFEVVETGILAALPFVLTIGAKSLGGFFLDRCACLPQHVRIVTLTSAAQGAMTVGFFLLTLLSSEDRILAQAIFIVTIVFSGLHCVGLFTASQTISQQHNHVSTSIIAVISSIVSLVFPVVVGLLAPNNSAHEWAVIFYYMIGALLVTNVVFVLVTTVKPADWTNKEVANQRSSIQ
ncbi:hypothetical protein QR680_010603 [Steinernema hermaphroditum]|uniref:Major facilitator superfamily (MFS) profile domain-containing protein n=1 Tax=Steinernema hermaphroditum TaxID=289476 RepID=A0AA39IS72_9BILA|nr:hypothetical protein QR680_010603 [Steinernema hermaphroditum]